MQARVFSNEITSTATPDQVHEPMPGAWATTGRAHPTSNNVSWGNYNSQSMGTHGWAHDSSNNQSDRWQLPSKQRATGEPTGHRQAKPPTNHAYDKEGSKRGGTFMGDPADASVYKEKQVGGEKLNMLNLWDHAPGNPGINQSSQRNEASGSWGNVLTDSKEDMRRWDDAPAKSEMEGSKKAEMVDEWKGVSETQDKRKVRGERHSEPSSGSPAKAALEWTNNCKPATDSKGKSDPPWGNPASIDLDTPVQEAEAPVWGTVPFEALSSNGQNAAAEWANDKEKDHNQAKSSQSDNVEPSSIRIGETDRTNDNRRQTPVVASGTAWLVRNPEKPADESKTDPKDVFNTAWGPSSEPAPVKQSEDKQKQKPRSRGNQGPHTAEATEENIQDAPTRSPRGSDGAGSPPSPKSYWNRWNKRPESLVAAASELKRVRMHDPYIGPAEPLPPISENEVSKRGLAHQVKIGKAAAYVHLCAKPEYLDTLTQPYAIFRFKYRSKKVIEDMFNVSVGNESESLKAKVAGMTRDQLVEEVLKMKVCLHLIRFVARILTIDQLKSKSSGSAKSMTTEEKVNAWKAAPDERHSSASHARFSNHTNRSKVQSNVGEGWDTKAASLSGPKSRVKSPSAAAWGCDPVAPTAEVVVRPSSKSSSRTAIGSKPQSKSGDSVRGGGLWDTTAPIASGGGWSSSPAAPVPGGGAWEDVAQAVPAAASGNW